MPKIVPQMMKAINTINLQPDKLSPKMKLMAMMDISGATGNDIAEAVSLTPARVSIIRNSPLYLEFRQQELLKLQNQIIDKKSTQVAAGDPVVAELKSMAMAAVQEYKNLLTNGKSEMVKKGVADEILDRAGYKPQSEQTTRTIEVTEKMASRFERILSHGSEPSEHARLTTVRITEEVSK